MRWEDGELWLSVDEWKIWVWDKHPEACRDSSSEPVAASQDELDRRAREDAKHWRAGRRQGALARTSPLSAERRNAERRDYWSGEHRP